MTAKAAPEAAPRAAKARKALRTERDVAHLPGFRRTPSGLLVPGPRGLTSASILVAADATGSLVDFVSIGSAPAIFRQVGAIGDPNTLANIAAVLNAAPASTDYGVIVRAILAQLPAALVGARLDVNVGATVAPDVADRAARLLGVIASITAAVDVSDRAARLLGVIASITGALPTGANTIGAVTGPVAATLALDATLTNGKQVAQRRAASGIITATGAASAAVTATVPAPGAGLFNYITRINIVKYASAAMTGAAAPVIVTTTNIPGALAWTTPTALAIGTQYETDVETLVKSTTANTATTVVAPVQTGAIWRINVYYYTDT